MPDAKLYHPLCTAIRLTFPLLLIALPAPSQAPAKVSFTKDIAPLLADKCVQCHGQASTMGNLNLRTKSGILKGNVSASVGAVSKRPARLTIPSPLLQG